MVNVINNVTNSDTSLAPNISPFQPNARGSEPAQPTPPAQADHVTLSGAVQAHYLKQQGQSVAQIATALGATAAAVDSYLGIVASATQIPAGVATAAVTSAKLA